MAMDSTLCPRESICQHNCKRPLIDVPMYQKWNLFGLLDPALLGPAMILDTFGVVVVGATLGG